MKKTICFLFVGLSLLLGNMAYVDADTSLSVGTDYRGLLGQIVGSINNSTDEATTAHNKLTSMGYDDILITIPTSDNLALGTRSNGRHVLESDVLYLVGHANSTMISWNYKGKGGTYAQALANNDRMYCENDYTYTGLGSVAMGAVDLAVFMGCHTADPSNTWNLAWYANNRGAKTTVGWKEEIPQTDTNSWTTRFLDRLAAGYSVSNAVSYANSFNYVNSKIKSTQVYGNSGATINSVSSSLQANTISNSNELLSQYSVNESILLTTRIMGVNKETAVGNMIKSKVNSNFNNSDFIVEKVENSDGVIYDFYYTVDGIKTNVGYTVFMNNDETFINKIIDNTKDFNISNRITKSSVNNIDSLNDQKIKEIKAEALKEFYNPSFNLEIVDEYKYYDILNNKLYYIVDVKQTDPLFNTSMILSYIEEI